MPPRLLESTMIMTTLMIMIMISFLSVGFILFFSTHSYFNELNSSICFHLKLVEVNSEATEQRTRSSEIIMKIFSTNLLFSRIVLGVLNIQIPLIITLPRLECDIIFFCFLFFNCIRYMCYSFVF